MLPKAESACFLIADISGYTSYLAGVELDHAQDIIADLMDTVVRCLRPPFRLAKFEGDAAFFCASCDMIDGSLQQDAIESAYFTFRKRLRNIEQATSCTCRACHDMQHLDLKFVCHHGEFIKQRMAGRDELAGRDVILVHRLLKNTVKDRLGDHAPMSNSITAPRPQVWEYFTSPGQRPKWRGADEVRESTSGGRRGVGTTNHCMHGPHAIIEEILDWRPFDYLTLTTLLPMPSAPKILMSYAFSENGNSVTHIEIRIAKAKAKDMAFLEHAVAEFRKNITNEIAKLSQLFEHADNLEAVHDVPKPSVLAKRFFASSRTWCQTRTLTFRTFA
jgi:uncharacterized protein YndB with AHSA1/START domain